MCANKYRHISHASPELWETYPPTQYVFDTSSNGGKNETVKRIVFQPTHWTFLNYRTLVSCSIRITTDRERIEAKMWPEWKRKLHFRNYLGTWICHALSIQLYAAFKLSKMNRPSRSFDNFTQNHSVSIFYQRFYRLMLSIGYLWRFNDDTTCRVRVNKRTKNRRRVGVHGEFWLCILATWKHLHPPNDLIKLKIWNNISGEITLIIWQTRGKPYIPNIHAFSFKKEG